jgi:hypothetical protein
MIACVYVHGYTHVSGWCRVPSYLLLQKYEASLLECAPVMVPCVQTRARASVYISIAFSVQSLVLGHNPRFHLIAVHCDDHHLCCFALSPNSAEGLMKHGRASREAT